MATLPTPTAPEFVSYVEVFPSSVITLAMLRALDSADDRGRIHCSTVTFKKLEALGLAEHRALSDYITHAGWNVAGLFPNPEVYDPALRPTPAHTTRTWQNSYESVYRPRPNGRDTIRPDPASSWKCSCGAYGGGASREEARASARRHRGQASA